MTQPARQHRPAKSPVPRHLPVPDPDVPADQKGHGYCARCGVAIVAGDPRHTLPDAPPEQAEHRRWAGEGGER
jgi:hypothetical protein